MQNLLPELLPRLEAYRLPGLDAGPQALYPAYHGYSIANLPASLCHWLGAPVARSQPLGPEILENWGSDLPHVIFLVVDGMGLDMLEYALEQARQRSSYAVWGELAGSDDTVLAPITSVVPSTTAAALTTFWSGCTPAEHAVLGYEVWLKEYGMIANMILHSPASYYGDVGSLQKAGFDPLTFLTVPTLGPHLVRQGVQPFVFQFHGIARSGLSTMLQKETNVIPYRSLSDLWATLNDVCEAHASERTYSYIYWGNLDEHAHRFGPQDERTEQELALFSLQLEGFVRRRKARARRDTLLVITADHGHMYTPRRPEYELRSHPELLRCLTMMPSGEARLPYVFLRSGCEEQFLNYLESTWPGQFLPVPTDLAIQSGLFGSGGNSALLKDRVGDYVVFPQGDAYWWFGSRDNPLLGRHGGLSKTEMLVPFLATIL